MLRAPIRLLNPFVQWVARLRVSLHTKLLAGFLFVTLLLLLVVGVNLFIIYQVEQRAFRVASLAEQVARAGRMEYAVTAQMHFRAMHLLTGDPANDQKLVGARQDFSTHQGYLEGVIDDGQGKAITARLREANLPFLVSGQKVDRLAQAGDLAGAMKVHLEEEHPASHVLEGLARDLIKLAGARWAENLRGVENERWRGYAVAGVAGVSSVGLALILGYVLSWPLLGAVGRLDEHLERVTRGDFSQEVVVPNGDEFHALAAKGNAMMHELARARAELVEQNKALAAQAQKVEELNRRLEDRVRQQATELSATRRADRASTLTRSSNSGEAEASVYPPGFYRCEGCGATGQISREVRGAIRCPRCKGTRVARVSPEPA
ncbi:MAG TPA: methyl-accepting chemotaxis protein [Candidatus Methylomirabilis sp.]|jgi:HAMP domain-containing protein